MYVLTLTARGKANEGCDLMEFVDMAHEWIVRGFADVTTKDMQKEWGRRS